MSRLLHYNVDFLPYESSVVYLKSPSNKTQGLAWTKWLKSMETVPERPWSNQAQNIVILSILFLVIFIDAAAYSLYAPFFPSEVRCSSILCIEAIIDNIFNVSQTVFSKWIFECSAFILNKLYLVVSTDEGSENANFLSIKCSSVCAPTELMN